MDPGRRSLSVGHECAPAPIRRWKHHSVRRDNASVCGCHKATAGVNTSPTDNLRAMLNYTHAALDEVNTGVSSANFVGMRLGLFW
jgi:hypothetical protein